MSMSEIETAYKEAVANGYVGDIIDFIVEYVL